MIDLPQKPITKLKKYIEKKIEPFTINEHFINKMELLLNKYDIEELIKCVDVSVSSYSRHDSNNRLTRESAENICKKIGGIAYNRARNPISKEIMHIVNMGKNKYGYWDSHSAERLLTEYVNALKKQSYDEEQIINDLNEEVTPFFITKSSWSAWKNQMESWILDINNWGKPNEIIEDDSSIIPENVYNDTRQYIEKIAKQINCSYEKNLFDCTALMMRRVLEILLILSYKNNDLENLIWDDNNKKYFSLEKIITNAIDNRALGLSETFRKNANVFRQLGNFSAHKGFYNCTKKDIEPHIMQFRVIFEELLYKSGVKK